MNLRTAIRLISSVHGFSDGTTSAGEAWDAVLKHMASIAEAAERVEERFVVFGRTNTPWAWTALEKAIRALMRLLSNEWPEDVDEMMEE